ncbi:hypothetical protein SAMN02745244_00068 [Tessaracoccus bendigoensis DSM 12906]|uniref:Uncharacterized protein n=1 Tax=Tessaracoccus bendigoensis DSM 12906 TaxID=1123357 RepID=A0A1M6A2G8_9ACTN|nr:hypothetical protein SAMN02745244_00068 [Tessaracoccus bendigoensis DSM 12906]
MHKSLYTWRCGHIGPASTHGEICVRLRSASVVSGKQRRCRGAEEVPGCRSAVPRCRGAGVSMCRAEVPRRCRGADLPCRGAEVPSVGVSMCRAEVPGCRGVDVPGCRGADLPCRGAGSRRSLPENRPVVDSAVSGVEYWPLPLGAGQGVVVEYRPVVDFAVSGVEYWPLPWGRVQGAVVEYRPVVDFAVSGDEYWPLPWGRVQGAVVEYRPVVDFAVSEVEYWPLPSAGSSVSGSPVLPASCAVARSNANMVHVARSNSDLTVLPISDRPKVSDLRPSVGGPRVNT